MNIKNIPHKLNQAIQRGGRSFVFTRAEKDTYEEETGVILTVATFSGIFHTSSAPYISVTTTEGARVLTKLTPQILCRWDDGNLLQLDDSTTIDGNVYKVTEANNFQGLGVACDVSLEKVM